MHMDNQGAKVIFNNLVANQESKHMDLRCPMRRYCNIKGIVKLNHSSAENNVVDITTEVLDKAKTNNVLVCSSKTRT